jgi:DNA-binding MarR family transcriptional regulator/GNAT superfamily N-acetyltransferase
MDHIDRIRAFNRFYTRQIGLLEKSYLDSGMTLTEVRVLYELANHPDQTGRGLAQGLGLDEGYLSRVLKRFGEKGWIRRRIDPGDRRVAWLALTEAGAAAFRPMAERARTRIGNAIGGLDAAAREALCAALDRARALLDEPPAPPVLRDLRPGDAGWVISRHGALYARDEGYDASFEALVAEILAGFLRQHDPARERGWIAEAQGRRLGSIFCFRDDDRTARLRLFLVEPEARGSGLGPRLLDACTGFAAAAGYRRMVLWTHESHRAALRLYARSGWRMTWTRPARSFGQDVVEQEWEREL